MSPVTIPHWMSLLIVGGVAALDVALVLFAVLVETIRRRPHR